MLFATLDVDRFLLEYDDERSGGFEPLRLVPEGKDVVLGLITTKQAALESPDVLRRRVCWNRFTKQWTEARPCLLKWPGA